MSLEAMLSEFDRKMPLLQRLNSMTVNLLEQLLSDAKVEAQPVTSRVKSRESLEEKLSQEDKVYNDLSQIDDLLGIRIITYFEDQLEQVDALLRRELDVVNEHSYDRISVLATDQFGYRSIHYVCHHTKSRLALSEYRMFIGQTFEIQTRSLLQHAWAQIDMTTTRREGLSLLVSSVVTPV